MAKGDIIADLQSIGNGGTLIYQPAVGVEVIMMTIGINGDANNSFKMTDGTIHTLIAGGGHLAVLGGVVKYGVTNTVYLRLQNDAGSTLSLGFSGIQSK
jgi:hypothetical protein